MNFAASHFNKRLMWYVSYNRNTYKLNTALADMDINMDFEQRFEFYEKVYFNEIDTKEKLHARVQGVFAFALVIATVISYFFKNLSYSSPILALSIVSLNIVACCFLAYSLLLLKRAFWGNQYVLIFSPEEVSKILSDCETYHKDILEYNKNNPDFEKPVEEPEKLLKSFVYERFEIAATHNMNMNFQRSENIHRAIHKMFLALLPLTIAMSIFVLGNLDGSAPRNIPSKKTNIIVISHETRM